MNWKRTNPWSSGCGCSPFGKLRPFARGLFDRTAQRPDGDGIVMNTRTNTQSTLACVALIAMAGVAHAQVDPRSRGAESLQPVEAGSVDSSPLAGSMQIMPIDLRQPTGFDQVYRVDTGHGSAFARMDGGLRAVFPRSEYGLGPNGVEAQIPAGTTWVIGDTPTWYADRFGMIATAPDAGPPAPGAGVLAPRVDLSASSLDTRAGSLYVGAPTFAEAAPLIDGVRVPMARPLIQPSRVQQPDGAIDLTGVLASPVRRHRIVVADEPVVVEPADERAQATDQEAPTSSNTSPWADDNARGRTVALLLLKAAGSDDIRDHDQDAVATVETDTE